MSNSLITNLQTELLEHEENKDSSMDTTSFFRKNVSDNIDKYIQFYKEQNLIYSNEFIKNNKINHCDSININNIYDYISYLHASGSPELSPSLLRESSLSPVRESSPSLLQMPQSSPSLLQTPESSPFTSRRGSPIGSRQLDDRCTIVKNYVNNTLFNETTNHKKISPYNPVVDIIDKYGNQYKIIFYIGPFHHTLNFSKFLQGINLKIDKSKYKRFNIATKLSGRTSNYEFIYTDIIDLKTGESIGDSESYIEISHDRADKDRIGTTTMYISSVDIEKSYQGRGLCSHLIYNLTKVIYDFLGIKVITILSLSFVEEGIPATMCYMKYIGKLYPYMIRQEENIYDLNTIVYPNFSRNDLPTDLIFVGLYLTFCTPDAVGMI